MDRPSFVIVTDQYMKKYQEPVSLWADRPEKLRLLAQPKAKRKRLFESPDKLGNAISPQLAWKRHLVEH